jgi:hypothetical protein
MFGRMKDEGARMNKNQLFIHPSSFHSSLILHPFKKVFVEGELNHAV